MNLTLVAVLGFPVCPKLLGKGLFLFACKAHVLISLGRHASVLFPHLVACNDMTLVQLVQPQWQVTILVLDGSSRHKHHFH